MENQRSATRFGIISYDPIPEDHRRSHDFCISNYFPCRNISPLVFSIFCKYQFVFVLLLLIIICDSLVISSVYYYIPIVSPLYDILRLNPLLNQLPMARVKSC